jgi:hypothetical protein
MKSFHPQALAFAAAMLASTSLQAQGVVQPDNEFTRQGNVPQAKSGTKEQRKAARQAHRAAVKEQAKAGEIINPGEASYPPEQPQKITGTHETRSAERKKKRTEMKVLNKSGLIPVTIEADVGKVKTQ